MTPPDKSGLYNRILSKEGIVGLLLFMTMTFIMAIVYQGQKEAQLTLEQINAASARAAVEQVKQTEILQDIRYALRAEGGLVFRNTTR